MKKIEKLFKYPKDIEISKADGKAWQIRSHITNHKEFFYTLICEIPVDSILSGKGAWDFAKNVAKQYIKAADIPAVCISYSRLDGKIRLYAIFTFYSSEELDELCNKTRDELSRHELYIPEEMKEFFDIEKLQEEAEQKGNEAE